MPNLIEGLQKELNRCRDLLKLYEEVPGGAFAASMLRREIKNAESSIESGEVSEMLIYLKKLQEYN